MRRLLSLLCCGILIAQAIGAAAPSTRPQQAILEIPVGAPVEVRLNDGSKLRGRLEQVRDDGFDLRVAAADQLQTKALAFSEVKSVKAIKDSNGGRIALYMLAGVGAFVVFLYAIAAAVMN